MWTNDGIAIAVLAGEIDLHRQARHMLQHEFADHSRVTAGAAGGDRDLGERAYLSVRETESRQFYFALLVRALGDQPAQHRRLFVDLFEHEMRKSILHLR